MKKTATRLVRITYHGDPDWVDTILDLNLRDGITCFNDEKGRYIEIRTLEGRPGKNDHGGMARTVQRDRR